MSKPLFPILRERSLLGLFRQRAGVTSGTLTEAQRQLAEEFRRGLAEALGVSPESIRREVVEKWVVNWSRAFVRPEYWAQQGGIRQLGRDLAALTHRTQAQDPSPSGEKTVRPRRTDERRDRWERGEISLAV